MTTTATITTAARGDQATDPPVSTHASRPPIPLRRIVEVELRKSFDTRSGFWLLAGIGIASMLTTGAVIAWARADQLTYSQFTLAIGVPMSIILPIIAALSVTSEWSQRSGLATFTLVPHRGRVLLAKALAVVMVALGATAVAFSVAALGNVTGTALADVPTVWDQTVADAGAFALANVLLMLVGFTLGALIRNSPGAIVSYMIYAFVAPGLLAFLAFNQRWFHDSRPWVDAKYHQDALMRGDGLNADAWEQLALTSAIWVALPLIVAVYNLLGSEVK